jgi:hypothetical protein
MIASIPWFQSVVYIYAHVNMYAFKNTTSILTHTQLIPIYSAYNHIYLKLYNFMKNRWQNIRKTRNEHILNIPSIKSTHFTECEYKPIPQGQIVTKEPVLSCGNTNTLFLILTNSVLYFLTSYFITFTQNNIIFYKLVLACLTLLWYLWSWDHNHIHGWCKTNYAIYIIISLVSLAW